MDALQAAEKLSPLGMALAAILSGAAGWWGWTWSHKAQLTLKDEVIAAVRESRDDWKNRAQELAAVNSDLVKQNGTLTDSNEKLIAVVQARIGT
jgi:hypothetical protein